ncbi:MAG: hypothetical protein R6U70_05975 [Bacillota bacterium]
MKRHLVALLLSIALLAAQLAPPCAAQQPARIWLERPSLLLTQDMSRHQIRTVLDQLWAQDDGQEDFASWGPLREPREGEIPVYTLGDLARIGSGDTCTAGHTWNLTSSYILMSDIDAAQTDDWEKGWSPIGWPLDEEGNWNGDLRFSGRLDGNGFAIIGLRSDHPEQPYQGLFGRTTADAEIRNLILTDAHITGKQYVGALAGYNEGTVESVYVDCTVSGTGVGIGGLIGWNTAAIRTSRAAGEVIGGVHTGGLIGHSVFGEVAECSSTAAVHSQGHCTGGLIGYCSRTAVERCHGAGDVFADSNSSGGLVGEFNRGGLIADSCATGSVVGAARVGGLVGLMINGYGDQLTISRCYSAGSVTGSPDAGGLIGKQEAGYGGSLARNEVTHSYWDVEASGQPSSDGGTAATTASMMRQCTYEGWDFDLVWSIDEGEVYPRLRSLATPEP